MPTGVLSFYFDIHMDGFFRSGIKQKMEKEFCFFVDFLRIKEGVRSLFCFDRTHFSLVKLRKIKNTGLNSGLLSLSHDNKMGHNKLFTNCVSCHNWK